MQDNNKRYSYEDAGFDPFLSRSIDNNPQPNLDSTGSVSRQIAYDRQQVTGMLGDSFQVGKIIINGRDGNITVSDGQNVRVLIGFQQDGFD